MIYANSAISSLCRNCYSALLNNYDFDSQCKVPEETLKRMVWKEICQQLDNVSHCSLQYSTLDYGILALHSWCDNELTACVAS